MTNAQAALIAAASCSQTSNPQWILGTAQTFKTWLDEQDGPKPPKPAAPRTDHSEVAVRRPAQHLELED